MLKDTEGNAVRPRSHVCINEKQEDLNQDKEDKNSHLLTRHIGIDPVFTNILKLNARHEMAFGLIL